MCPGGAALALLGVELLECAAAAYCCCFYSFETVWPLFLQVVFLPLVSHRALVCAALLDDVPQSPRPLSGFPSPPPPSQTGSSQLNHFQVCWFFLLPVYICW